MSYFNDAISREAARNRHDANLRKIRRATRARDRAAEAASKSFAAQMKTEKDSVERQRATARHASKQEAQRRAQAALDKVIEDFALDYMHAISFDPSAPCDETLEDDLGDSLQAVSS